MGSRVINFRGENEHMRKWPLCAILQAIMVLFDTFVKLVTSHHSQ